MTKRNKDVTALHAGVARLATHPSTRCTAVQVRLLVKTDTAMYAVPGCTQ